MGSDQSMFFPNFREFMNFVKSPKIRNSRKFKPAKITRSTVYKLLMSYKQRNILICMMINHETIDMSGM